MSVARDQADLAAVDEDQRSIAVVFDLVEPAVALRRLHGGRCELRAPLRGHGCGDRSGDLGGLAARHRLPGRGGRLVDRSAGHDAVGRLLQDVVFAQRARGDITLLDQQPVRRIVRQALQHPAAGQLLAGEAELDLARGQRLLRVGQRHPGPTVPDDHRAGAVVAGGDATLEAGVVERVIFDQLCETPHLRVQARPLRNRPALQRIAHLQTQVVVQAPGVVFLDHEDRLVGGRHAALRLRRLAKAPLGSVGVDAAGHGVRRPGWRR